MKKFRLYGVLGAFFLAGLVPLGSLEIRQGGVLLLLHENTGHFALYALNRDQKRYEPYFSYKDPSTSFIELNINDQIFRLGESPVFRVRIENNAVTPAIIFDSTTLQVRQEFTFIQTAGSPEVNGIRITIRLINIQSRTITVGMRVLFNTRIGSAFDKTPFFVNNQRITTETLIAGGIGRYWISQGGRFPLMGSIGALSGDSPDYLHIADWALLNESSWTSSPKSRAGSQAQAITDPAICYYYEPKTLRTAGETSFTIFLAIEDPAGFNGFRLSSDLPAIPASLAQSLRADLALLADITESLDRHTNGEITLTQKELADMELIVTRIKELYSL